MAGATQAAKDAVRDTVGAQEVLRNGWAFTGGKTFFFFLKKVLESFFFLKESCFLKQKPFLTNNKKLFQKPSDGLAEVKRSNEVFKELRKAADAAENVASREARRDGWF